MHDIFNLIGIVLIILYPLLTSTFINYNVSKTKKMGKSQTSLTKNIFILIVFYMVLIGGYLLLSSFYKLPPNFESNKCTYMPSEGIIPGAICYGDSDKVLPIFIILGLITIIHHILSIKPIYNIFKSKDKVVTYIFMYIYMLALTFLPLIIFIQFYMGRGINVYITYNNTTNIIRVLLVCLPFLLFIIFNIIIFIKNYLELSKRKK